MKKKIIIVGIVLAVLLGGLFAAIKGTTTDPADIELSQLDMSTVEDGVYTGEYSTELVSAQVQVNVADGEIQAIEILQHDCGLGKKAEVIVDTVVADQSIQVDTISGATTSSMVILKAVENAVTGK